ncbi:alpha/beta hydrolase [Trinickia caryophylli]|uniref:Pimeloyl-ACP methyl ester carboxylesterase n=1 Tax=Trinickia caryophylli TaxID=28094 RepID=A0A1X7DWR9_TRICW|nr:alpha/beta hydrolase [Trinickia caryophylli]PMS14217.1 alpha/beta hydrolase [Trinickia caryophylli]TRX17915.1 alpha/beta hydrolase [Trinickia caryophylli]WQE11313.1 alpha/beta hydrolase [Trinickia caryophylli]SMF23145.1 Pimeloyl-ACP methyl ester carboxylesterase [Trinickia caryophylli]GLU32465.1 hydrolase [Trinickia caryophylli]
MQIRTRGTTIHVETQGSGNPALVFLHYWGGSSRTWDGVARELRADHEIVAIDHRGWGESGVPDEGYGIADMANDAQDVIEALGLRRYVLVGHSMGGKVAQLLASRRPTGLEGLVLVAPSPPSAMALPDEQRKAMAGAYDSRESICWVLDHVLTAQRLSNESREQVIADSLRGARKAKEAWPNAAMLEDITADVGFVDVPVQVIAGELDQVDRVETLQKELLSRMAGARLHVLPGIGHLSPLEAPSAVAALIGEFVRTVRARIDASVPQASRRVATAADR